MEGDLMNSNRKILLSFYCFIIFIVGVLFTPYYYVITLGSNINIKNIVYAPIWKLMDNDNLFNGVIPRYELCTSRAVYQLVIITIITIGIYLILDDKNKKIKKEKDLSSLKRK